MITYKDCPDCGTTRIRADVSKCSPCEVASRYEDKLDAMRARAERAEAALRDVAERQREACAKSIDMHRASIGWSAQVGEMVGAVRSTPLVTEQEEP